MKNTQLVSAVLLPLAKHALLKVMNGQKLFRLFVEKYSGDQPDEEKHKKIAGCTQSHIIAIDVEHLTGKEAIEYVRSKG